MSIRLSLKILSTPFLACLACSLALGQSPLLTRAWVSGVGDDVNPCTRTAPCKSLAGAISRTVAGGEINVLDPGGYGPATITGSISIESRGELAGVSQGDNPPKVAAVSVAPSGITVSAGSGDVVVLRGLTLDGSAGNSSNGISFIGGGTLYVENCAINNFQKGIDVTGTGQIFIKDTVIRNNVAGGIHLHPSESVAASLESVRLENNRFGLRAEDGAHASMRNGLVAGTLNSGIIALSASAPSTISVENTMLFHNGTGGVVGVAGGIRSTGPGATVNITNVTLFENFAGLLADAGGSIISFGNNRISGNGVDGLPTAVKSQQ